MDLNKTGDCSPTSDRERQPAPETISRKELIEVAETLEKLLRDQRWELQRQLSQVESRLMVIEASRDREFSAEVARRLRASKADHGPDCYPSEVEESLSSRLRRAREL